MRIAIPLDKLSVTILINEIIKRLENYDTISLSEFSALDDGIKVIHNLLDELPESKIIDDINKKETNEQREY